MSTLANWIILTSLVPGSATSLQVATFNINWGDQNLPSIVSTINECDADIVCLQETTRRSERLIRRSFADKFRYVRFIGYRGKYRAERFGILSKYPIKKFRFDPPKHGLFGIVSGYFDVGERSIHLVNVHLTPFTLGGRASPTSVLAALSSTEDAHRKEIESVIRMISADTATLIVGDFNSLSTFIAPTELQRLGFVDSFAAVTEFPDSQHTWHWPLRIGELRFRIDYIFHSKHFTTESSEILIRSGSDHYLLTSKLSLADVK